MAEVPVSGRSTTTGTPIQPCVDSEFNAAGATALEKLDQAVRAVDRGIMIVVAGGGPADPANSRRSYVSVDGREIEETDASKAAQVRYGTGAFRQKTTESYTIGAYFARLNDTSLTFERTPVAKAYATVGTAAQALAKQMYSYFTKTGRGSFLLLVPNIETHEADSEPYLQLSAWGPFQNDVEQSPKKKSS